MRLLSVLFAFALICTACTPKETATPEASSNAAPESAAPLTIGVMPKLTSIPYFNACEKGAREAAAELGVTILYDGPTSPDVTKQVEILETWIAKGVDAIAIAPNDPEAIAPVLTKARKRGIEVLTWDADARADARDFFVNQATNENVAQTLMDVMAKSAGENAKYVIITGTLTASNQNLWMDAMEKYRAEKYPNMTNLLSTPIAPGEDQARATQMAGDALKAHPDLQGIFAITSVALPGAAEALRKANAADRITLVGLSQPNTMREYIKDGTIKEFVLWNPIDLGYLTMHAAVAAAKGELSAGATSVSAGRLGDIAISGSEIVLGPAMVFDKVNVDQYDF